MLSKEEIDAGINADEDEKATHLNNLANLAAQAGIQVGGNAGIPALLPDGSLAEPEDAPAPEAPPPKT